MAIGNIPPQPDKPEFDSNSFDLPGVTRLAIDQVIVDGEVDGDERRAPFKMLAWNAFRGMRAPSEVFRDFRGALPEDVRFLDKVSGNYGYDPMIYGKTEAVARPGAIISERGMFSEEQFKAAMERMGSYAEVVYSNVGESAVIVDTRKITGVLRVAGIELTRDEFHGFCAYTKRDDSRLRMLADERVVLLDRLEGDIEEIPELPRIEDFTPLIDAVLRVVATTQSDGRFRPGMIMGAMKDNTGDEIRPDQVRELIGQLHAHPGVEFLGNGFFRTIEAPGTTTSKDIGQESSVPAPPQPKPKAPESLDAMMNMAFDGNPSVQSGRKPRNRRSRHG